MDHYSPLRYPGGKGKISNFFKEIFKENLLYDGIYIEPYAGGASVALSLLFNEYASKIIINDFDYSIYSFWYSVVNYTDELCRLIYDTPININIWEQQREIQKKRDSEEIVKLGFSTFFLNRTNRSGIINAGVIGGRNQLGKWKIDARYNKKDLINRIQRIGLYKSRIAIHNLDAGSLIDKMKDKLPKKALFYFDPPYYAKGKDLYLNYYEDNDHILISNKIQDMDKCKWILTYDNVKFINSLYKNFRQIKYELNYSVQTIKKGEELMIFSNNLFIPHSSSMTNMARKWRSAIR